MFRPTALFHIHGTTDQLTTQLTNFILNIGFVVQMANKWANGLLLLHLFIPQTSHSQFPIATQAFPVTWQVQTGDNGANTNK